MSYHSDGWLIRPYLPKCIGAPSTCYSKSLSNLLLEIKIYVLCMDPSDKEEYVRVEYVSDKQTLPVPQISKDIRIILSRH